MGEEEKENRRKNNKKKKKRGLNYVWKTKWGSTEQEIIGLEKVNAKDIENLRRNNIGGCQPVPTTQVDHTDHPVRKE